MLKRVKKGQWIYIIISTLFNVILMLIFYFIDLKKSLNFDYYYLSALIGAINLLLGWMIPNHFDFEYRRKNAFYKGKLPIDIRNKMFSYRFPLMISGIIALIISCIFSVI